MSRRRWTAPLFGLALLIFWACLLLPGWLYPKAKTDAERRYTLNAQEAALLRNVVIDAPLRYWDAVDLSWSREPVIELTTDEPPRAQARLTLVREGDTLHVRPNPETLPDPLDDRPQINKLRLPMTVERVQGVSLSVSGGPTPARLELAGRSVSVKKDCNNCSSKAETFSTAVIEHLHVVGLSFSGCGTEYSDADPNLDIDASRVGALELETLGGKVELSHIGDLPAVSLQGPPDLNLNIDRVTDLSRIAWSALPPERERALREMAHCPPESGPRDKKPEKSCRRGPGSTD